MKWIPLFAVLLIFNASISAQDINPEIFRKNVDVLYTAADAGFKSIKGEETGTTEDGDKKYHSTRKVSGAMDVYIKVDGEDTHTYIAVFESKDMKSAQAKMEQMAQIIFEEIEEKGFARDSGTDMSYEGYRKATIEFASDNIDDLGHHPSFSIGILRGSNPPVVELEINEPLWK
ncbi:MAG: hypothetical protein HQ500_11050 [Flavobacteriales bacterium]|nr:hypothetical protein [Flavobacteriales bacterium]